MRVDLVFICVALCVASFGGSASSVPKDPFLGISPEDESYYKTSSDAIKCKNGSKKFSKSRLNDDFCDCPDGTDEPGTSACPTGKFYCRNIGHIPQTLFSSRVNDGICDCCDGSDEYDGQVKCPNACWEAGKATRVKLKKKIATYQEGVTLRKQEIEQARMAMAKDEAELTKLINEEKILKGLVQQLKEHKELVEKAEEIERLQKEKEKIQAEEALRKESEPQEAKAETGVAEQKVDSGVKSTESTLDNIIGTVDNDPLDEDLKLVDEDTVAAKVENGDTSENEGSPLNRAEQHALENKEESAPANHQDDSEAVPETGSDARSGVVPDDVNKMGNDLSENTGELSREGLGRLVASRWTGENTEKHDDVKDNSHEGHEDTLKQIHDEEYDGYASDTDDDTGKSDTDDDIDETDEEDNHDDPSSSYKSDDDIDLSDTSITTLSNPSWLEKIQQTVRNILQAINLFQTPVNISDASNVRKEYDESSSKLSKIQARISALTKKLKQDFGPEKEFYSFYDHCFESKENKYVYKVCPYKQASQVEGYATTRLGEWEKFDDSYRVMVFSNGERCWNGPDRSLKIKLRCGLKNEITDVDEPSRCEYVALLSTPALCTEDKLKELQNKLDMLNKQQPPNHDEL